jgi:Dolichyl-phosphate-mannose-protein mannosyltransferase
MLVVALLIGIGLLRIVSTYHVFNHTIDEGAHLACGIQWFQNSYTYDPKHTPIARISIALLPYLSGVRGFGDPSFWQEGVLVLSSGGHYWRNLTLARIGVLPYYVLAVVVIFVWSRRVYGSLTALIAAGTFSMLPVVLAHSAVATTDVPLTAFFTTAVYAFTLWLATPSWRTAVGFGVATGLAISTKLSTVAFLPPTMVGILLLYFLSSQRTSVSVDKTRDRWGPGSVKGGMRSIAVATLCVLLVIWTVYRFSHAPIKKFSSAPDKIAAKVFGPTSSATRGVQFLTSRLQLPAPELYNGLRDLRDDNRDAPRSYLLGRIKQGGWWYFYPVAIAVKTPLAVLLLALIGAISLAASWLRSRADWQRPVPLVAFVAILVVAAPTKLDIGVRHVMPVFAFLSMMAAVGTVAIWNGALTRAQTLPNESRAMVWGARTAVVALFVWFVVSSARVHPDYLSYFNELGGSNPANILVISDVDWGQDFTRLSAYLSEQQIQHLSIGSDNYFDPATLGFPETVLLKCRETATGWIVIEERRARVHPECYQWVTSQPLKAYVGKTMRVYYIPKPTDNDFNKAVAH